VLDSLPAWLRHIIIMVLPILLGLAANEWLPWLQGKIGASLVGGVVVTFLTLLVTALTKQYGVGKDTTKRSGKPGLAAG